jgi:hypothetical protein
MLFTLLAPSFSLVRGDGGGGMHRLNSWMDSVMHLLIARHWWGRVPQVLRFRLILAEWVDDVKRGVGRPGGVLHCSSTMELKRGMEGANENGYVCFELDVPEEGGLGGVKKGMSVILAASTEGLTCDAEAGAARKP